MNTAITRRSAMALLPGALAAGAAATAVHEPEVGPFELAPRRVWSAPNGERVVSLIVLHGDLYVATDRGIYVQEGRA